eukprot:TRINITY_DN9374_c1_g1_i1.p1 TRINITY_DN9374_c1_g1~~TRINITY_DN9374_c1_g1_i1.p1  ORF type:complete len:226 (-),score=34.96 TRINITY_DN9374_c1_g1_i1:102-710(-)
MSDKTFPRQDDRPDQEFYAHPRFVTHIDDPAIKSVTQLYREFLPPDGAILDLMSSWISHLPEEIAYKKVVGLGMNQSELSANPRLTSNLVHDLNINPSLPFKDKEFDGACICVSVDYLTKPVSVLREIGRVLRPGCPLVITFSNRCFPTKAISVWHTMDDRGRVDLVKGFLGQAGNFRDIVSMDRSPHPDTDPLYAVIGRST